MSSTVQKGTSRLLLLFGRFILLDYLCSVTAEISHIVVESDAGSVINITALINCKF